MIITSYYRGSTDKLSGLTFDTTNRKFRIWTIKPEEWCHVVDGCRSYIRKNEDFRLPGDLIFCHPYRREVTQKIQELQLLGFVEDPDMTLSFRTDGS